MIARLFKGLGVPMDWIDSHDAKTMVQTIGDKTGLFFVEDAASATDMERIQKFLLPGFKRCTSRITPITEAPIVD